MSATTIRISKEYREILREMSERVGSSMTVLLETAIEEYRQKVFFEQFDAAYAELQLDAHAWEDEQAERNEWEATLADGID